MIGILGASGVIGATIKEYFEACGQKVIGTYAKQCKKDLYYYDLEDDYNDIFKNCNVVVIAGSMNDIDACAKDKKRAEFINVEQTIALIEVLNNQNKKIVFLSSDQVFDCKDGGYKEDDACNPINVYGEQKHKVENWIIRNCSDYIIARLSKTYSLVSQSGIFYDIKNKLKNNNKVFAAYNQMFNFTDANYVASSLYKLLQKNKDGIWHIAVQKIQSRYAFALEVAQRYAYDTKLIVSVDFLDLQLKEKRGLNSWLNVDKLEGFLKADSDR